MAVALSDRAIAAQLWLLDGLVPESEVANPAGRGGGQEDLSEQQRRFIGAYLRTLNATKAAVEAGYSEKTARQQGARLLSNAVIVSELRRQLEEARAEQQLTVQGVLEQLRRLAFSDIRTLYRADGSLKEPHEWPDDIAARVAGVEVLEVWEGTGKTRRFVGHTKKVKVWNPNDSLKTIAAYLKMLVGDKADGVIVEGDFRELSDEELRERARQLVSIDHA